MSWDKYTLCFWKDLNFIIKYKFGCYIWYWSFGHYQKFTTSCFTNPQYRLVSICTENVQEKVIKSLFLKIGSIYTICAIHFRFIMVSWTSVQNFIEIGQTCIVYIGGLKFWVQFHWFCIENEWNLNFRHLQEGLEQNVLPFSSLRDFLGVNKAFKNKMSNFQVIWRNFFRVHGGSENWYFLYIKIPWKCRFHK